jgi:hypothetical protein
MLQAQRERDGEGESSSTDNSDNDSTDSDDIPRIPCFIYLLIWKSLAEIGHLIFSKSFS